MTSKVTPQEAYRGYNDIVNIRVNYKQAQNLQIVNVSPNPWTERAEIEFFIPQKGQGVWEFYDVNGRSIYTKTEDYKPGVNTMTFFIHKSLLFLNFIFQSKKVIITKRKHKI